jgi:ParB family transcriptional regulator, chromosome partitioning protein
MIDAGLSTTRVAKALSVHRDTVKAAAAAAKSPATMDALTSGQMTLLEAPAVVEFDDDPDAIADLQHAAGGPMFDHTLSRLRRERGKHQGAQGGI